jgi:hypothetical protein
MCGTPVDMHAGRALGCAPAGGTRTLAPVTDAASDAGSPAARSAGGTGRCGFQARAVSSLWLARERGVTVLSTS